MQGLCIVYRLTTKCYTIYVTQNLKYSTRIKVITLSIKQQWTTTGSDISNITVMSNKIVPLSAFRNIRNKINNKSLCILARNSTRGWKFSK